MADGETPELLTLQEAADRLKVHYMTAYRWVRRGDLPAFKAGGRLRVQAADVDRFVQQRRVDVILPAAGRTDWPTHVDRLYNLLIEGRASEAAHLVRKVIADGAPAGQVYLELLTPALYRVGDAWEAGTLSVAQEHLASEICAGILARNSDAFRRRGPSRGTAVTMTPPEQLHGLGAAMVADFLRAGGYDVHHLGINVPYADLRLFLQVVPCDVLCVSLSTPASPELYSQTVAAAQDGLAGAVVFGGRASAADLAAEAGALHVDSLADLVPSLEEYLRTADAGAGAAVSAGT